jgi:hypothetical protein
VGDTGKLLAHGIIESRANNSAVDEVDPAPDIVAIVKGLKLMTPDGSGDWTCQSSGRTTPQRRSITFSLARIGGRIITRSMKAGSISTALTRFTSTTPRRYSISARRILCLWIDERLLSQFIPIAEAPRRIMPDPMRYPRTVPGRRHGRRRAGLHLCLHLLRCRDCWPIQLPDTRAIAW